MCTLHLALISIWTRDVHLECLVATHGPVASALWFKWLVCTIMTQVKELPRAFRLSPLQLTALSHDALSKQFAAVRTSMYSWEERNTKEKKVGILIYLSAFLSGSPSFSLTICPHWLPSMYLDLYYCVTQLFTLFSVLSLSAEEWNVLRFSFQKMFAYWRHHIFLFPLKAFEVQRFQPLGYTKLDDMLVFFRVLSVPLHYPPPSLSLKDQWEHFRKNREQFKTYFSESKTSSFIEKAKSLQETASSQRLGFSETERVKTPI